MSRYACKRFLGGLCFAYTSMKTISINSTISKAAAAAAAKVGLDNQSFHQMSLMRAIEEVEETGQFRSAKGKRAKMVRVDVKLPTELSRWAEAQAKLEGHRSLPQYISDLMRNWQDSHKEPA